MTAPAADGVDVLLCDADGTLFPSEEPAFQASAQVTNRLLASLGVDRRYSGEELRAASTGRNFRTTATELAARHDVSLTPDTLQHWVDEERSIVTEHLTSVLHPDYHVIDALQRLAERFRLAVVTSSAQQRLAACLRACELDPFFPTERRFSAEDSLTPPVGKPKPAIYLHALSSLAVPARSAVAVEDSAVGATSAVAAGVRTVGILAFTPADERPARRNDLRRAGAESVAATWAEVQDVLLPSTALPAALWAETLPPSGRDCSS